MASAADPSPMGLRERKKLKTRTTIQQHALALFRRQGYAATTIEQIAEAAEISPSTFFRYYPSKEDVVVRDAYDELFCAAVIAQPAELSTVLAVRATIRSFMVQLAPEVLELERDRLMLIMSTPELRARMMGEYPASLRRIAAIVATRTGRRPDEREVLWVAGALLGVGLAAMVGAADDPGVDYFQLLDEGLIKLDAGLPRL